MAYGSIKVDNIIYTKGGSDTTITVSGIVDSLSGAISVTGSISGASVSAPTGTFTTLSGNTTAGTTATFVTGVFTTSLSGATITGNTGQFSNITGVSGVFTTRISGATITGNTGQFTSITGGSGVFTSFSGTTVTATTGVFASGTAAAPSISVGTTTNGLYSSAANEVAVSTSGNSRLVVDASGNVNIDAGTFYVDAVNNYVGVGTTGPTQKFHVSGTGGGSFTSGYTNTLARFNASTNTAGQGAALALTAIATKETAWIIAAEHTSAANGDLVFYGYPGGASYSERLRLDASGNLGLGVTPSAWGSTHKALQMNWSAFSTDAGNGETSVSTNAFASASTTWNYRSTAPASRYTQDYSGKHIWYTAPSGFGYGTAATSLTSAQNGNSYTIVTAGNTDFTLIGAANNNVGTTFTKSGGTGTGTGTVSQNITFTQAMTLDASGNLGLGVTPSAWSGGPAYEMKGGSFWANGTNGAYLTQNAYYNGSNWIYKTTSQASYYLQGTGVHYWYTAPSGTAGAAISFTQAMTLSAAGGLSVGPGSDPGQGNLVVGQTGTNFLNVRSTSGNGQFLFFSESGVADRWLLGSSGGSGDLVFRSGAYNLSTGNERVRITSAGSLTVNGATSVATGTHTIQDSGSSPNTVRLYNNTDSNNTTNRFLICDAGASVLRAEIRSNGGLANYSANNANLSDRNAKKDITPAAGTWDCIKEWEIVNYRYKDQPNDADLNLGVIAQQVAESCPEVITIFEEAKDDQPEKLGVKEQQMYWMAIKALQEAQVRIEQLEAKVAALESR